MKKGYALFAIPFFAAAPSFAQTVGETCDSATAEPVCNGNALTICVDAENATAEAPENTWQVALDCAADLTDLGGATCGDVAGYGAICQMNTGGACLFSTGSGTGHFPCATAGEGCGFDANAGGYVCSAGAGSCTPAAEGQQYAANCSGNRAVWACDLAGQPIYDDCDAIGGTCQDGLGCVEVQAGGICDGEAGTFDGMNGPYWTCASGLTCEGLSDTSYGACSAGGGGTGGGTDPGTGGGTDPGTGGGTDPGTGDGTDPGTGGGSSRDDEEEEPAPSGCSATHTNDATPVASFAAVALLGMALIRRRR